MKNALAVILLALLGGVPLLAQVDLSGSWAARNFGDQLGNRPGPGPSPVDYLGIPLNENARARALSYSPSQISMPDRLCSFYTSAYMLMGPFGLKIWNELESRNGTTVAWHIGGWEDMPPITIWMDGRPHPSESAPHSKSGFTTGEWKNDILMADTTHLVAGYMRRNGVPASDRATIRVWLSRHEDWLTVTERIDDPIYLTEPYYLTRTFELTKTPIGSVGGPCVPVNEGVAEGKVPFFLPGENPFVNELTEKYNIPRDIVLGGAETMYPEANRKLKGQYRVPEKCLQYCGGPGISR